MQVTLCAQSFDPWQALQEYQANLPALKGKYGATAVFVGTMRDFNQGDTVTRMTLEHYPGMTERYLHKIIAAAQQQWAVLDCLVVHRVGDIAPNQPIVLVVVWSAQRGDAFSACQYILEQLKSTAPFWKQEHLADQTSRWVTHNSSGYQQLRE